MDVEGHTVHAINLSVHRSTVVFVIRASVKNKMLLDGHDSLELSSEAYADFATDGSARQSPAL